MPTNQPSNDQTDLPQDARDDRTAASVMTDEQLDDAPGGGGLGGAAAGAGMRGTGGAAPNAPLAGAMGGGGEDEAGGEARTQSVEDADEVHPSSQ